MGIIMPITVLFDLDDTLLKNDINLFLPAYLRSLGEHLARFVDPNLMIRQLLSATDQMIHNNDPRLTLERAFDSKFYPAINIPKDELYGSLEDFYEHVFPNLRAITDQISGADQLVQELSARGHTLVIATNPLFPRRAMEHRIDWSGVTQQGNPFVLITSYENFHFSKPNPAYYAEILAQLGWLEQPSVVIGNSLTDDLLPASTLGIPGFWVTESPDRLPDGLHSISSKGSLQEALSWIDTIEKSSLSFKQSLTPSGLLAYLKSTPAALFTQTQQYDQNQWSNRPEPGEWSITEILCHLRDVEMEINLPRIKKIITGENPFLPGINSDTWIDERMYSKQDGKEALRIFADARFELIECLKGLDSDAWKLPARHAIFGPTNLHELISFITTHDGSHIQQCVKTAKETGG